MNYRHVELILAALLLVLLSSRLGSSQSFIDIDQPFYKGDKNAKVVLIEFADYQCPFCARFERETFPRIDEDYVLTGKVKFIFRNFPLESHPGAFKAAEAAICAGEQGKFWAMHSRLFRLQDTRDFSDWTQHAKTLALNSTKFTQCLESEATASKVRKDLADGKSAGVKVTPTFFLGRAEEKSPKMTVLNKLEGAGAFSRFKEALDNVLTLEK
jgi:protein-disulfide isomerase